MYLTAAEQEHPVAGCFMFSATPSARGALHFALCPLVVIARYYVYFKIRTQWTQLDSAASSLIKLVGALYVFTSSLRPPGITYYTFSYFIWRIFYCPTLKATSVADRAK